MKDEDVEKVKAWLADQGIEATVNSTLRVATDRLVALTYDDVFLFRRHRRGLWLEKRGDLHWTGAHWIYDAYHQTQWYSILLTFPDGTEEVVVGEELVQDSGTVAWFINSYTPPVTGRMPWDDEPS